jgi:hypothetical protein
MHGFQDYKIISVTPPAAKADDASFTTAEIDTRGFDRLAIIVYLGDTDIAMAALKVTESDTTGSGHTDITGLVYGTSTGIDGAASALPSATDDNKFFAFELDLRGRKRFIDVTATAGNGSTGTYAAIFALGFSREENLQSAANRGFANILRV